MACVELITFAEMVSSHRPHYMTHCEEDSESVRMYLCVYERKISPNLFATFLCDCDLPLVGEFLCVYVCVFRK